MTSPARSVLTWIGRLLLLAVPVILLCGLYEPRPIQALDRVVCSEGLRLGIDGNDPDDPFDNRTICESAIEIEDATGRLVGVAGICFVLAVGAYTLRGRITPASFSAPNAPQHA